MLSVLSDETCERSPGWRLLFLIALVGYMLTACETKPLPIPIQRQPQAGFCDLSDDALRRYVVAINIVGESSSSGVATLIGRKIYVLTNRHNLPRLPKIENIQFRNYRHQYTKAADIIIMGRDYAEEVGLGPARDYAVLSVKDPSIFVPLPLHLGRHEGAVVVPSYAARLYEVGRGSQWFIDELFDRLDFNLAKGASGAPVITCNGEISGLYTALIRSEDFDRAGFKGISTPIMTIISALTGR